MYWLKSGLLAGMLSLAFTSMAWSQSFGRPAAAEEIRLWDIDVRPDGVGLPTGSGTVARGKELFDASCFACHGLEGVGASRDRLVGGIGSLTSNNPVKTVGSYWPFATTLFDYIRRAMPYSAPGSLSNDDTYALSAYILNLNGILPADATLDKAALLKVKMPNRDGFFTDPEFAGLNWPL
jgi:cytochrome c